jgi:histidinol-phosphate aminotransferase
LIGEHPVISRPVHGGIQDRELRAVGIDPASVTDFSASINPLGPPARVLSAVQNADYSRYPDPDCRELREAIAAYHGVSPEQVLAGNGATELIHLIARAFVARGKRATIAGPTFSEYAAAVAVAGGRVTEVRAREEDGFQPDLGALRRSAAASDMTFLCNPNNPTGVYLSRADVLSLIEGHHRLCVVDEAYVSFVHDAWNAIDLVESGQVLIIRSLTKDYAIPGLRLGYLVGDTALIERVRQQQVTWSVNAGALAAGLAALGEGAYLAQARALVHKNKRLLVNGLRQLGLTVMEGAANFVLVNVGDAGTVRQRLLRRRIVVRDCASFGLPRYIRIGVRTEAECRWLLAALRDAL